MPLKYPTRVPKSQIPFKIHYFRLNFRLNLTLLQLSYFLQKMEKIYLDHNNESCFLFCLYCSKFVPIFKWFGASSLRAHPAGRNQYFTYRSPDVLIVELRTSPKTKCGAVAHLNTLWIIFRNDSSTLMDCNFKSICRIQEFLGVLKRSGWALSQNT